MMSCLNFRIRVFFSFFRVTQYRHIHSHTRTQTHSLLGTHTQLYLYEHLQKTDESANSRDYEVTTSASGTCVPLKECGNWWWVVWTLGFVFFCSFFRVTQYLQKTDESANSRDWQSHTGASLSMGTCLPLKDWRSHQWHLAIKGYVVYHSKNSVR
jgi:hypothetical protein